MVNDNLTSNKSFVEMITVAIAHYFISSFTLCGNHHCYGLKEVSFIVMIFYDWETCFLSVRYSGANLQTTTHIINFLRIKNGWKSLKKGWKVERFCIRVYVSLPFLTLERTLASHLRDTPEWKDEIIFRNCFVV